MPTHEEIIQALGERGAEAACVMCGANEWIGMGTGGQSDRMMVPSGEQATPDAISGYPVHGLYCNNCGFVRLHHATALGV